MKCRQISSFIRSLNKSKGRRLCVVGGYVLFLTWIYCTVQSGSKETKTEVRTELNDAQHSDDKILPEESAPLKDSNIIPAVSNGKYLDVENVTQRRLEVLHGGCQQLGLPVKTIEEMEPIELRQHTSFLLSTKHCVTLTSRAKTGSTTWKLALFNSSGDFKVRGTNRLRSGQPLGEVHQLSWKLRTSATIHSNNLTKSEIVEALRTCFTIITVRHPFDRLESAYVDKVISENLNRVRERTLEDQRGISAAEAKLLARNGRNVKFEEFLAFAMTHGSEHWTRLFENSYPCIVPYSFIGKSETFNRDLDYVIESQFSGMGRVIQLNSRRPKSTSREIQLPLFSKLENQTYWTNRVYNHYKEDFELFGYSYSIEDGKVYGICTEYDHQGKCV